MSNYENILKQLKKDLEDNDAKYTYKLGTAEDTQQCYQEMRSIVERYMSKTAHTERYNKAVIWKQGPIIKVEVWGIFPGECEDCAGPIGECECNAPHCEECYKTINKCICHDEDYVECDGCYESVEECECEKTGMR
jgi:hypothetical protein